MELRKDPVTQSWMLVGDELDAIPAEDGPCMFCAGGTIASHQPIYRSRDGNVNVYPHPHPLYKIEGVEGRVAEGIYDRMRTVGAHEVVVENTAHDRGILNASDGEGAGVLSAFAARIIDLKRDVRFRYVTV